MLHVHHVNLQPAVGGGEVYTRWLTRALADAGAQVSLYVDRDNRFWDGLDSERVALVPIGSSDELAGRLPERGAMIITQSALPEAFVEHAAREHVLTGFAHLPMRGRSAEGFRRYARVFAVSRYCIGLLRAAGLDNVHDEPMYGTFALEGPRSAEIVARSPYQWDRRKFRDRLLGLSAPFADAIRPKEFFARRGELTLGVVSLISPIKQFPLLFRHVAPIIARHPQARLEVFGNGGYAQVRDLRLSLAPLGARMRLWGHQSAVQQIYPQLDYLMTGLPEKEALGLNALEAQACGTPVLAVNAPPFTETVLHERSGFLYRDPREDGGREFGELLAAIAAGQPRPDPRVAAAAHLEQFSYPALVERTGRLVAEFAARHPRAA